MCERLSGRGCAHSVHGLILSHSVHGLSRSRSVHGPIWSHKWRNLVRQARVISESCVALQLKPLPVVAGLVAPTGSRPGRAGRSAWTVLRHRLFSMRPVGGDSPATRRPGGRETTREGGGAARPGPNQRLNGRQPRRRRSRRKHRGPWRGAGSSK